MTIAKGECPICRNEFGTVVKRVRDEFELPDFDCPVCGRFKVTKDAYEDYFDQDRLSPLVRSALSHITRSANEETGSLAQLSGEYIEHFRHGAQLPTPFEQARNAVRVFGRRIRQTGEKLERLPVGFHALIGSRNPEMAGEIVKELFSLGWINGIQATYSDDFEVLDINLTLSGWEVFEQETLGHFSGKYGFIAMKFGDAVLDELTSTHLKPRIEKLLGYKLVDVRDVARAGVIDNIIRQHIRDCAFVIADLTHANNGAYWEAGYAEGLGKPVIYICEQSVFDEKKTHFDTNHCTTVMWSADDIENFIQSLIATIRRSLNLFDS